MTTTLTSHSRQLLTVRRSQGGVTVFAWVDGKQAAAVEMDHIAAMNFIGQIASRAAEPIDP